VSFFVLLWIGVAAAAHLTIPKIPANWDSFKPILTQRLNQKPLKMKLTPKQVDSFADFLNDLKTPLPNINSLQTILPKTTLELLMAVHSRGLPIEEAEKMAAYLEEIVGKFKFQNRNAFDENTSHIIGREWHEIDYSGENMTWQKQKLKYQPYGITNFKSLDNLIRFFAIESKLPYFKKIYRPKGSL
jgi:hypothetical protein